MNETEWRSGPPPYIGWWNASRERKPNSWRWWNGHEWSWHAPAHWSANRAAAAAKKVATAPGIEWRTYYPENARVPRVDPRPIYQQIEQALVRLRPLPPVAKTLVEVKAREALALAHRHGLVLTISQQSVGAPRMGGYTTVVEVREARQ